LGRRKRMIRMRKRKMRMRKGGIYERKMEGEWGKEYADKGKGRG
jgi:hypothetical protein